MRAKPYDEERLGQLLALLLAAPRAWVERAKRIPSADRELAQFLEKLEADETLRKSFDTDPVAAAEGAGMRDLAGSLKHELESLVRLAALPEAAEVVAHGNQEPTSRLRALLLRSEAAREQIRSAAGL